MIGFNKTSTKRNLMSIMFGISSDQGSPSNNIFSRHLVKHLTSYIQISIFGIHIENGILQNKFMFKVGIEEVGVD